MLDLFRDLETESAGARSSSSSTRAWDRWPTLGQPIERRRASARRGRPARCSSAPPLPLAAAVPAGVLAALRRRASGEHHRGGHRRRRPRSICSSPERSTIAASRKNAVLLNRGADGFVLDPDHPLAAVSGRQRGAVGRLRQRRPDRRLPVPPRRQSALAADREGRLVRRHRGDGHAAAAAAPRSTARCSTPTTTAISTCC